MFKKMAKAIRNVDEREGHCEATAAFVDSEFSDNSGVVVKALRSNVAWKKNRVNAICDKAARIMEDRHVARAVSLAPMTSTTLTAGFACTRRVTVSQTRSCNVNSSVSTVV